MYNTVCTVCKVCAMCTTCTICLACSTQYAQYVQYVNFPRYVQCVRTHVVLGTLYSVPNTWYASIRTRMHLYVFMCTLHVSVCINALPYDSIRTRTPIFKTHFQTQAKPRTHTQRSQKYNGVLHAEIAPNPTRYSKSARKSGQTHIKN